MTTPILQTFYINEPVGGAEGVFLTKVDLYFAAVSSTFGVELQIRQTDNGNPTPYILPYASKILQVTDTDSNGNALIISSVNATIPTTFVFDTPIFLQSQTSYALAVVPVAGNPDYQIWTSELGGNDITSGTPVKTNNDTGTLFLSSNDKQFTAIQSEDMKFTLYTATFTANTGSAVFNYGKVENLVISDMTNDFSPNEKVFISNSNFNLARLTTSLVTGTFTASEVVYQSNGTANIATGVIYFGNTTSTLVTNSTGSWSTAYNIKGAISGANATVSAVSQSVNTNSNTTITVPFTGNGTANLFYVNQTIYVASNTYSYMTPYVVTNVANLTTIIVDSNVKSTDTTAFIGQVRGDNYGLYGFYTGPNSQYVSTQTVSAYNSTSNTTVNFSNASGSYLIGYVTGTSAYIRYNDNVQYDAIVPQFSYIDSKSTNIDVYFSGVSTSNTLDTTPILLTNKIELEFFDTTRALKDNSNEITNYAGSKTTNITHNLSTSNNKISPYIDTLENKMTLIKNRINNSNNLVGFNLAYSNSVGIIKPGDNVSQNVGAAVISGTVLKIDAFGITVGNISSTNASSTNNYFVISGNNLYNSSNVNITTSINKFIILNEKYGANVMPESSRYVSKSVILADGQDSDDLKLYLGAYRPANTNWQVYARFNNAQDTTVKPVYSRLVESSNTSTLFSSSTNRDDFVELIYGLPSSSLVYGNSTTCNTTSANVSITNGSTSAFNSNSFVYLAGPNNFIVRQVISIANSSTLVLDNPPSFTIASADIGIIPGLEHVTGVFNHANNYGIARYVSAYNAVSNTQTGNTLVVTQTGNTTISNNVLLLNSTTGILPAMAVSGNNIPTSPVTTVVSVNSTAAVLSQNATGTDSANTYVFSSYQLTGLNTANLSVGMFISGNGVVNTSPTTITAITNSTAVAMSQPAYANAVSNTYTFILYNSAGDVVYDTFKKFSIKLVPVADNSYLPPRAGDVRAIALQV